MNKIRTTMVTAAIAGASIVGLAGVTGIADAATDSAVATPAAAAAAAAIGDADGADTATDTDRAERRAARQEARQTNRQEIADVLGLSVDDLSTELRGGATLADVAEANGVAVSDVVDVIVQQKTERIELAVENGRITAEEAAEKTVDLNERVQTRVDEGRPERGDGEGRRGNRGPRGGDVDTSVEAPAVEAEG
jgi:hypothetical protein